MRTIVSVVVGVVAAACGRIGFDPEHHDGGDANGLTDDANPHDAPGSGSANPDAPNATACSDALTVTLDTPLSTTTCQAPKLADGCGPVQDTMETVFKFVAPSAGGYSFRALDHGTNNVSSSTAQLDAACTTPTGACAGILGITLEANETAYFVVQSATGACTDIDFEVSAG